MDPHPPKKKPATDRYLFPNIVPREVSHFRILLLILYSHGRLNEDGCHRLLCLSTWSPVSGCLERIRRCGFAEVSDWGQALSF